MATAHIDRLDINWNEFIALNEQDELGRPADADTVLEAVAALVAMKLASPKVAKGHTRDSITTDGRVDQLDDIMVLAMVRRTMDAVELFNVAGNAVNSAQARAEAVELRIPGTPGGQTTGSVDFTPDTQNSRVTQLREKQAVEMMGNDSSALEVAYKLAGVESCQISPLLERLDLKKLNRG